MTTKCPKADNWCTTEFQTIKTSFQWVINNFSGGPEKTAQKIQSSTFSSDKDITTKWQLSVYPYGNIEDNQEFVSIFLKLVESNRKKVSAQATLAIVDSNQQIHKQLILAKHKFEVGPDWGYGQFHDRSEPQNHWLINDRLIVFCEITYSGRCKTTSGQNVSLKRSHSKLLDDITALYETPALYDSDVEILVKGHKFSAHKPILMARSSVFAAMFKHQMIEKRENKVVINDIEKEVFSKVLRFIYTEKVVNEDIDSSIQLLSAADKYNLDDLKSICEEYIGSQLTVESVSDVLILADNHSAQELKAKAIDFVKKNLIQVMKTKGWKKVIIDRSDLLDLF